MSGNTANQGYPYPLTPDFADVQDGYRLASAIDGDLRDAQNAFRSFVGRPSFITRQAANASGFSNGSQTFRLTTLDWDNTGGAVLNASSWVQPNAQAPSWWMFGATLLTVATSGTPVVGDLVMAKITVSTTDQVSGVTSVTNFYQRDDETNTNGQWINVVAQAPIYRGSASLTLVLNGSTSKAIAGGSTFWGFYLGPVI